MTQPPPPVEKNVKEQFDIKYYYLNNQKQFWL